MEKQMHVTISEVDKALFDGFVHSLTVPGVEGEMTILPEHEAFITPLAQGTVTVRAENLLEVFQVREGICEISNNQVTVLL